MSHDTEESYKILRKTDLLFQDPSTLKSQKCVL